MVTISENLYLWQDTCNVYVVKSGRRALLIDVGAGGVLDRLNDIGVDKVDWVLHTHAHRDQCQGDTLLALRDINLAVPEKQRSLFEQPAVRWRDIEICHNYNSKPDFFEPTRAVHVDKALSAEEGFDWEGIHFDCIPHTGPDIGDLSGFVYIATIDGVRVAFSGDLIHSPGRIWQYYDFQWGYKQGEDADATLVALGRLQETGAELILPSHGITMANPNEAISALCNNWDSLRAVLDLAPTNLADKWPNQGRLFPHLWQHGTMFVIVADNGRSLIYDTGGGGDTTQYLESLKEESGLKQIDLVLFSHYHDDHVGGARALIKNWGAKLWLHECLSDVIEHPFRYNLPCIGTESCPTENGPKADRILRGEESFEWEGWTFTVMHFPGQTEYHQAMFVEMDGHRMLFMGDSLYRVEHSPGFSRIQFGNLNCRNYCRLGEGSGYMKCAEILKRLKPDVGLAGHLGAVPLGPQEVDEYCRWAEQIEPVFRQIIAREDPNFGVDRNWASFYPYRILAQPEATLNVEARIRNHLDRDGQATVSIVVPERWSSRPRAITVLIPAKSMGAAEFQVELPEVSALPMRTVLTANVVFDGQDLGELIEMIVDR